MKRSNRLLRVSALIALLAPLGPGAHALGINDSPNFDVDPVIILWAAEEATGNSPVVVDFVVDNGSGGSVDLIGGTSVDGRTTLGGSLSPTEDSFNGPGLGTNITLENLSGTIANIDTSNPTAFAAFSVEDASTETSGPMRTTSSLFIASNTPYNISANVTLVSQSGDFGLSDVTYNNVFWRDRRISGVDYGANAQTPGQDATTISSAVPIDQIDGANVVENARVTAVSPGTIAEQSVRMQSFYQMPVGSDLDLSDGFGELQIEVVFTAYVA